MSIGETLAEARHQAGLTVPQLSQQTRIRETIIRGIEQDDYSGCGGDFYARGHIRAMARAIGADPVPLIQEYDESFGTFNGLDPAAEAWSNVRVSQPPGEPGQAGPAPSVFDPAPPPTQASPVVPAGPPPSAPTVFAPTHRPPPGHADPAYPAPSVFDAVDQVPRDPGEAGPDAYQPPYEAEHDPYQPPPETGDDLYQPPYEANDDPYQPPPETGNDLYQPPYEAEHDAYQPSYEAEDDAYQPSYEAEDGAGPALMPQLRREPSPAPPPVTRVPRPPQVPPGPPGPRPYRPYRQPPPRPPARDRERDGSWISSVFDSAPENPAEITEPNGVRPAIAAAGSKPPPRREHRLAIFAVAALVVVGLLAYLLANVFSSGSPAKPSAGATASQGKHPTAGGASSHPSATPSQAPSSAPPAASAPVALPLSSATAFGPSGPGQGDNQQEAAQAIDRKLSTGWASDWYSTSHFGNLQSGTGLLLNLGGTASISSAVVRLASTPGSNLQLRVGSSPSLAALKPVAHANNVSGVVRFSLSKPARGRYALIWFTALPLDSAGTYQARVFNIALRGNG